MQGCRYETMSTLRWKLERQKNIQEEESAVKAQLSQTSTTRTRGENFFKFST